MKCVIVATSHNLSNVSSTSGRSSFSQRPADNSVGTSHPALQQLGSTTALKYWLSILSACPQLQPLSQNVFILCSSESHEAFLSWASSNAGRSASLPPQNIISTHAPPATAGGVSLFELAQFHESTPVLGSSLLVIYGMKCLEPDFKMARFVQHALVRAKDCVCFTAPLPGCSAPQESQTALNLQDDSPNPRIAGFAPATLQEGDESTPILGPLTLLRDSTLPAAFELGRQLPDATLLDLLGQLTATSAVYGLPAEAMFDLGSSEGRSFADGFFRHCEKNTRLGPRSRPAAMALAAISSSANWNGAGTRSPARQAVAEFAAAHNRAAESSRGTDRGLRTIPARFADATLWRHTAKAQHPVYSTSNNEYGAKAPIQPQLTLSWNGVKGEFTKDFVIGEPTSNFSTAVCKSKVHKSLDDF